ncbi:acyl-CoA dehydrogenase [Rhodococcus rhodnii]|uniref:Acyl-CoA dehydrogenase n=2 Tax=Rhodococcus rhodnii TaxID=38312 RepID=A0A6P2CJN6_9NOCA|nr:acyl-CoA dehydrogenase family protein [Rhodococcus rhodnii]EOM78340.1 putative acyl-CoA dehydrogenase [Rhodococcus rhodnii LMG 5362]TXG91178.1 acyl-CoA dehydrogenase [Rhodococcus rhodnii]
MSTDVDVTTLLPLPGEGETAGRWDALISAARRDLVAARFLEAHNDAAAILHELGADAPRPGQWWGVWAAEPPDPVLRAVATDAGHRLRGRKPWCSGAHSCTHALVTATREDGRVQLFAVDLGQPSVRPVPDSWHAIGMAASDSGAVDFDDVPAQPIGEPGDYLARPGFWHGAIGVAACWFGGALAVGDALRDSRRDDPFTLAHLGAVDAAEYAARAALEAAARETDLAPDDTDAARIRARRVRAIVEHVATATIDRVGRALGPGPLTANRRHAQLVADLGVYLRQSHAERDLAALGADARAVGTDGEGAR